jgi:hypothetical protein
MKRLIGFLIFLCNFSSQGQEFSDSSIGYNGGYRRLRITVLNTFAGQTDTSAISHPDSHSNFILTINKEGKIKTLTIFCYNDSALVPLILEVARSTNGQWINRTNGDVLVNLQINYLHRSDSREYNAPNISQSVVSDWKKEKMVFVKPLLIERLPDVK